MRAFRVGCSALIVASVFAAAPLAAQTPADAPPATAQAQRNWLLARLVVDHHLTGQQVSEAEQKLANMSADQLDVLLRVYQEKHREQAAAAETELGLARENLNQLKNTRDALAQEVQSWRDYRQAQYVNFGAGVGSYNYGAVGGYGWTWPGYSFGYGIAGYPYAPYGSGLGVYPNVAPAPYAVAPYYAGYPGAYGVAYPATGVWSGFGVGVY